MKENMLVYVYAFGRRFYPKRLTNEDIKVLVRCSSNTGAVIFMHDH